VRFDLVGLSHQTSDVATRERAAIGPERLPDALARLVDARGVDGAVVVSTCMRVEAWLAAEPEDRLPDARLADLFREVCGVPPAYVRRDADAARHLFRVASGLDSVIVGEPQILSQVRRSWDEARAHAASQGPLNALFLRAVACGKAVRHQTGICRCAPSVASAAVEIARSTLGSLDGRRILVVGAGRTSRLAARHLQRLGAASWRVSNRSWARASSLAEDLGGEVTAFPPSSADLAWADLVVSATSAPDPVITERQLEGAGSVVLLDLAVPRDVSPSVAGLPGVRVFTVDDVRSTGGEELDRAIVEAQSIVATHLTDLEEWCWKHRLRSMETAA